MWHELSWEGRNLKLRIGVGIVLLSILYYNVSGQDIKTYLQSPSDTSIWITWKTAANTESKILYGLDSTNLNLVVTGGCNVMSDIGYNNNYFYHSVELKGLEPDQYYHYRAVTGSLQSPIYRFRTQPLPGTKEGVYRFLVFGDHQVKGSDRYRRLLVAARDKIHEKYGGSIEEHVHLVINDGDQVDLGTLDQYEFVHFGPSDILSGNVPIMTTVGNHETYGSLGLSAYYDHFFYDNLGYKGIASPGAENYYSYQQKNIVFVHLSSEHPTENQVEWVQRIVDSVKVDDKVDWLISVAHRPIQAEQFVGDISKYIRDRIIPVLGETDKSTLFISGHHHLYARGQVRDHPMYHIISGGGSWDQYWGQSVERDFDDVQKTIDFWTYQIVTINGIKKEMVVESYAIGSPKLGFTLDNVLIDSFYRRFPVTRPATPAITTTPADSVTLPFIWESTPYDPETSEPYNSVQFQIASEPAFSNPEIDLIRDFENLYGTTGSPDYLPVDIHDTVNIFQYTLRKNALRNGTYHIRVRHRDRNITWSEWSDPVQFNIRGSLGGITEISVSNVVFRPDEAIPVTFVFGPGNQYDWIGIYRMGETPGTTPSTDWQYVDGSNGSVNLTVPESGKYYIAFFEDDGYVELANRIEVYVVSAPAVNTGKPGYNEGEEITIQYSNAPGLNNDWIGIYKLNDIPGWVGSTLWDYTSGKEGEIIFSEGLQAGYYFASYFIDNVYIEAGERTVFAVGSALASITTDKPGYQQYEPILVAYSNSPGLSTDWIGIFRQDAPPGTAPLVTSQYTSSQTSGDVLFEIALEPGPYYAALFINNSNNRISNTASFTVEESSTGSGSHPVKAGLSIFPSPSSGRFSISANQLVDKRCDVKIVSITGKTVYERSAITPDASFSLELNLSEHAPGVYLVYLSSGTQVLVKKLVLSNY